MNLMAGKNPVGQTTAFTLFGVITIGSLLLVIHFDWMPVGMILWILFLLIGLFGITRQHAKTAAYACPGCEAVFKISAVADFLSPQLGVKKLLKCPHCGQSSWCREVPGGRAAESGNAAVMTGEKHSKANKHWLYAQVGLVLLAYLGLWANALSLHSKLPETLLTYFVNSDLFGSYGNRSALLTLPAVGVIFPLLHAVFCLYAARQRYKSVVYPIFTGVVIAILIVFAMVQNAHLAAVTVP